MTILPYHPSPKENESLTSWISRVAIGNGTLPYYLLKILFGEKKRYWYSDIDVHANSTMLSELSYRTGKPVDSLEHLTLAHEIQLMSMFSGSSALPTWILPAPFRPSRFSTHGQQICPLCLLENEYYKKSWRLGCFTVCTAHKIQLIDQCPNCGSSISLRKLRKSKESIETLSIIFQCGVCGFDYRAARTTGAKEELISISSLLESLLWGGRYDFSDIPQDIVLTNQLFEGIRYLSELILCRKKSAGPLLKMYGVKTASKLSKYHGQPVHCSVKLRAVAITIIYNWIKTWPNIFCEEILACGLHKSDILGKRDLIPRWIENVIDTNFRMERHIYSEEENRSLVSSYPYLSEDLKLSLKIKYCSINRNQPSEMSRLHWDKVTLFQFFEVMTKKIRNLHLTHETVSEYRYLRDRFWFSVMAEYLIPCYKLCQFNPANSNWYQQLGKRARHNFPIRRWYREMCDVKPKGMPLRVLHQRVRFRLHLNNANLPFHNHLTALYPS